ncbi:MAG: hypothetical protein ABIJ09_04705 [Pseudomonadota bacterium]
MQVGRVGGGALYGTSHLWHDPDYSLDRANPYFRVQKALDTTLPYQEHVEPEKAQDPYQAQEKGYDVAFAQMTRGIEGRDFLHGVKNPEAFSNALQTQAVLRSQHSPQAQIVDAAASTRAGLEATQTYVAPPPGARSSQATSTAGDKEAEQAAQAASNSNTVTDVMSLVGGAVTTAATVSAQAQALQALGSHASHAITALQGAVTTSATAAGQTLQAQEKSEAESAAKMGQLSRAFSKSPQAASEQAVEAADPLRDPSKQD